jgi:hypothetical protein
MLEIEMGAAQFFWQSLLLPSYALSIISTTTPQQPESVLAKQSTAIYASLDPRQHQVGI